MRMGGVVCAVRAEELLGKKLGQRNQYFMGVCEERSQLQELEDSLNGTAIQSALEGRS
jgi:hypothetical protein